MYEKFLRQEKKKEARFKTTIEDLTKLKKKDKKTIYFHKKKNLGSTNSILDNFARSKDQRNSLPFKSNHLYKGNLSVIKDTSPHNTKIDYKKFHEVSSQNLNFSPDTLDKNIENLKRGYRKFSNGVESYDQNRKLSSAQNSNFPSPAFNHHTRTTNNSPEVIEKIAIHARNIFKHQVIREPFVKRKSSKLSGISSTNFNQRTLRSGNSGENFYTKNNSPPNFEKNEYGQ
jgi:predicted small metal-binding protein